MYRKSIILIVSLILLLTSVAGAVAPDQNSYPLTIMDDMNNSITIEDRPERIVSTMPSNTEILFAIGAGDRVVGGTIHDDYPPEAANVSKIGGYTNLEFETIVDLQPDIVFADEGNGDDAITMLRDLGITVVVLNPRNIDQIMDNIELIGLITGNEEQALAITDDMRSRIANIQESTMNIPEEERPRVLYIVWHDPLYSAGENTYPDDLISIAGGSNIQASEGWPIISLEDVIEKDPQMIICSGMGGGSYTIMEAINTNDVLAQTDAVKSGRVYPIAQPSIIERSGPRIVDGLEELYSYMGPDAFGVEENITTDAGNDTNTSRNSTPGFGVLPALTMLVAVFILKIHKQN